MTSNNIFRSDFKFNLDYSFKDIQKEIINNISSLTEYTYKPTFDEYWRKDIVLSDPEKYSKEYAEMQKISKGFSQVVLTGSAFAKRTGSSSNLKVKNILSNTFNFLDQISNLKSAAINILTPNTMIAPHMGLGDGIIKGHLVIKSNTGCKLFVQTEEVNPFIKDQKDGDCYYFDDTPLHWAGNKGTEDRYILVWDFVNE